MLTGVSSRCSLRWVLTLPSRCKVVRAVSSSSCRAWSLQYQPNKLTTAVGVLKTENTLTDIDSHRLGVLNLTGSNTNALHRESQLRFAPTPPPPIYNVSPSPEGSNSPILCRASSSTPFSCALSSSTAATSPLLEISPSSSPRSWQQGKRVALLLLPAELKGRQNLCDVIWSSALQLSPIKIIKWLTCCPAS